MSDDLSKMTRDELNNYAGELGLPDAAEYPNKSDLIAAIEAATAPDNDEADADDDAEPEPTGQRYEVLKAVTDDAGQTYMPGETFVPGPGFPSRRPKQLVDQKFLRPLD